MGSPTLFRSQTVQLSLSTTSALAKGVAPTAFTIATGQTRYSPGLKVLTRQIVSCYLINAAGGAGTVSLSLQGCPAPLNEDGDEVAAVPYADLVNGTDFASAQGATTGKWYALGNVNLSPYIRVKVVTAGGADSVVSLWLVLQ